LLIPRLEKHLGIEAYATRCSGIGGVIRRNIEDFLVEEVLVDRTKATIGPSIGLNPLGSSPIENDYLLCVLVKRNWDTISAVKAVADQLGTEMDRIQFAGLKDTKAITAQHITFEGLTTQEIRRVHVKDIELRPVGYLRNGLSQFYLLGNSFHVRINRISHLESTTRKRINRITEELEQAGGFPNFFGHQRFGTTRPITHQVGKAIIRGDFKKAAMIFLARPSPREHSESRLAREALQATMDFGQALKDYPKQLRYERLMLRHLARKSQDYVGAFRRLPLRLLELFPQAYQSYLFNRFLSRRLSLGLTLSKTQVGDCAVNVERSGLPILTMHKVVGTENAEEVNDAIQAGKMKLAIPLLGYKHRHSAGVQGEFEKEILGEESISLRDFKVSCMPEISLRGRLRVASASLNDFCVEKIAVDPVNPKKLGANMSFTLYRGSYATVVLRELMKPRNLVQAGF
jgi:tRNA pseudouridine13 synthase